MSVSSCQVWCHFSLRHSFHAFTRHTLIETAPEDYIAKAVAVSWLLFQNSGQLLITYRLRHIKSGHGFNTGTFPFRGFDYLSLLLWNIRSCIMMYVRHTLFGHPVSDTFWNQMQLQSRCVSTPFVILCHSLSCWRGGKERLRAYSEQSVF